MKSEKEEEIEFRQEKEREKKIEEKEIHKIIKEKIRLPLQKKFPVTEHARKIFRPLAKPSPRILRIPEPRLPPRFQYLKPIATNVQIDLGKLNPLIKDPAVSLIECNGSDEKIIVRIPSIKTTSIILSKEEINDIIKKFSETAKIPVSEGIFKVAVGRLILTAVVSEVTETKFIIKKIMYQSKIPRTPSRLI